MLISQNHTTLYYMSELATKNQLHKEHVAELLRERIYATFALLAVLVSIDTGHSTPLHTELVIAGTIFSLWAASLVATLMARRVVYQNELDPDHEREHQLRRHAPMLATLAFPTLMILLSALDIFPLAVAVNISIASALLLLVSWSILSARSMRAKRTPIIILIAAELLIGLGVVALKIFIGH